MVAFASQTYLPAVLCMVLLTQSLAFLLPSNKIDTATSWTPFKHVAPTASKSDGDSSLWANPAEESTGGVEMNGLGPNAAKPGLLRRMFPSAPWHRLPNFLTYIRCVAIPLLIGSFYIPGRQVESASLFAVASFTDWMDGYLARRWDITSDFGAFLDPVADKLMVSTSLILLSGRFGAVIAIPSSIILARELAVSALREWMAQRGERDSVKVGFQGKVKTALTMLALSLLLLVSPDRSGQLSLLYRPSIILLYMCAAITVSSGAVYFRSAAPVLLGGK